MPFDITRRNVIATGAAAAMLPFAGRSVVAQGAWPTKPIKIIAGFPAGGQTDLFSRSYGEYIARQLGQPVVVENKTGAGGSVAAIEVKRAAPDGYTLMVTNTATIMTNPAWMKDIGYDVAKDFVMISMMPSGSLPLVASEKTGAKNLKEFIDYAKKTEKVSIGTYAAGSYAHVAIEELNKQYGLKMEAVHYRGEAPMWADLAGQSIDAAIGSYLASLPVLQTGKGRAVAVSRKRMSVLPDVATLQEQGATSRAHTLMTFQCCVAPVATSPEIVRKLSELFVAAGKSDKIQEMLKSQGLDEAAMPLEESQRIYKEEAPIWRELIAALNLSPM